MRELHDTVGARKAFVVNHKATWKIKQLDRRSGERNRLKLA
jgi:hypothetical protein